MNMGDSRGPLEELPKMPPAKPIEKPQQKLAEQPPGPWTPDMVQAILSGLAPLADRYIGLKEKEFEHDVQFEKTTSRSAWWVLSVLMLFLAVVITLMSFLVLNGRVSGDALLFLVGTVSGYILALVQRHLFPEVVEAPTEG